MYHACIRAVPIEVVLPRSKKFSIVKLRRLIVPTIGRDNHSGQLIPNRVIHEEPNARVNPRRWLMNNEFNYRPGDVIILDEFAADLRQRGIIDLPNESIIRVYANDRTVMTIDSTVSSVSRNEFVIARYPQDE